MKIRKIDDTDNKHKGKRRRKIRKKKNKNEKEEHEHICGPNHYQLQCYDIKTGEVSNPYCPMFKKDDNNDIKKHQQKHVSVSSARASSSSCTWATANMRMRNDDYDNIISQHEEEEYLRKNHKVELDDYYDIILNNDYDYE